MEVDNILSLSSYIQASEYQIEWDYKAQTEKSYITTLVSWRYKAQTNPKIQDNSIRASWCEWSDKTKKWK